MSGAFSVHPEEVGGAAKNLLGAGQSLSGAVAQFQARTAALSDAFGNDDLGSALGTIYQIASEAAFDCFADNAEGLQEVGHNLQAMADSYAETESASQESFQRLLGGLG